MGKHSIAEAEKQLSELIVRARDGEAVVITEDGEPIAQITPVYRDQQQGLAGWSVNGRSGQDARPELKTAPPRNGASRAEWLDWLAANRVGTSVPVEDAATLVSRMRDEGEH